MKTSNLTNSFNTNLFIVSALSSCLTLTDIQLTSPLDNPMSSDILPSGNIKLPRSYMYKSYSMNDKTLSNETTFSNSDFDSFNVLLSFADKMLNHSSQIDEEIQNVINECFWDML